MAETLMGLLVLVLAVGVLVYSLTVGGVGSKPGGEIETTQGAVDLFGLIGSVMRPQGGGEGAAAAQTAGEAPAATAPDNH